MFPWRTCNRQIILPLRLLLKFFCFQIDFLLNPNDVLCKLNAVQKGNKPMDERQDELSAGEQSRREFLRSAVLLGVPATAAYSMGGALLGDGFMSQAMADEADPAELPADPIAPIGLDGFAERFRSGDITSEDATRAYLKRIELLDGKLGAYQHVDAEQAIRSARTMDELRGIGVDLGPLMGVPISVKDLLIVNGMPTTAGSDMSVEYIIGTEEGPFVRALRTAGCVILGKTKTVEFALGITGVMEGREVPWNPWDLDVQRVPGGSTSGGSVAAAAGLCAFSIGTDTGGSVRVPAALNGLFGLKLSPGIWPIEGSMSLASHLDTIGLLTLSAKDAAIAFTAINKALGKEGCDLTDIPQAAHLAALKLARPEEYIFDNVGNEVAGVFSAALDDVEATGAGVENLVVPEAPELEPYMLASLPVRLLATLGHEQFEANKDVIDPSIVTRLENGKDTKAVEYVILDDKRDRSIAQARKYFDDYDAWVTPTVGDTAKPAADFSDPKVSGPFAGSMVRTTQPANYLDLCATTIAIPRKKGELPVGFQVICRGGEEAKLLSISLALEELFGRVEMPDMTPAVTEH